MVSINRKEFLNLSITSCKRLFSDKDPDVRKSAAYAAGQIYQHDPARAEREGLIELLNQSLYDENSVISVH